MHIGDFARLGNVSVRTIRFYDQTRLLSATHRNADSGYRSYDVAQLARLRQIRAFQELGFSLKEIRELVRRELPGSELRAFLEQRRADLRRQIRDDHARLARLERRLHDLAQADRPCTEINVHRTSESWIVSVRERLRGYEEAADLFEHLERNVPRDLLAPQRAAFWHACESSGRAIDCEAVRFLKRRPAGEIRGVRLKRVTAITVASMLHRGDDDSMSEAYRDLNRWLASSGFRLRGPKREIYWREARGQNGADGITEIQYPVRGDVDARRHAA